MKLSSHLITLCLASLLILQTACSTPADEVYLQKAEKISNQLLDAIDNKRYDEAIKIYSKRFYEHITPEAWKIDLRKFVEKLGHDKSRKITASSVTHGFNRMSAVTTVLVYRVNYENSYSVQKFTFMSNEQGDEMSLVGHYIDFPEQK